MGHFQFAKVGHFELVLTPVLARLRTASEEPASGVAEELDALVGRIRESWPETRIILRTDSGFCRDPILSWCERTEGVEYVTGLARNPRLQGRIADAMRRSEVADSGLRKAVKAVPLLLPPDKKQLVALPQSDRQGRGAA